MVLDKSTLQKSPFSNFKHRETGIASILSDDNTGRSPLSSWGDFSKTDIDWEAVYTGAASNPCDFEEILFTIHFKRNKRLPAPTRLNVLKFLTVAYLSTKDVRYFNEFLWLYTTAPKHEFLFYNALTMFFQLLDDDARHSHPKHTREEIFNYVELNKARLDIDFITTKPLKIGLIGSPSFFPDIYANLSSAGHEVYSYFLPYHPDKKINLLFNSRILFSIFCRAQKVNFPFTKLDFKHTSPKLKDYLKEQNLDIGFHKLGFIIKSNIIEGFNNKLLNDHWAALPYIRGRSTLAYSILHGFPVCSTIHYVDEGVDTGNIISIFDYTKEAMNSMTLLEATKKVKSHLSERVAHSINKFSHDQSFALPNVGNIGSTYYSMHRSLEQYVEHHILQNPSAAIRQTT